MKRKPPAEPVHPSAPAAPAPAAALPRTSARRHRYRSTPLALVHLVTTLAGNMYLGAALTPARCVAAL